MAIDNEVLVRLFEYNGWASRAMLDACRPLTAQELEAGSVGTYGTISQTLIHLARAQGGYVRNLTDWQPGPEHRLEYDEPFPGLDAIQSHLSYTAERLIDVARTVKPEDTARGVSDGGLWTRPAWLVLLQAATHATEHRQQLATTLTSIGRQTPEPDLWAFWDAVESTRTAGPVR